MKSVNMADDRTDAEAIQQFAKKVHHFSSQYGSETSLSYTVPNLAGRCAIYPDYGDFTQACVFRTYGPWWINAPSAQRRFIRTPTFFNSVDCVELVYEVAVFVKRIEIFETYNPGAVVRIRACDLQHIRWVTLWSGSPEKRPSKSRIFSPPLKQIGFPTNLICIELNPELCEYYTELDSVRLSGIVSKETSPIGVLKDLCGSPTDYDTALREYGTPVDPFPIGEDSLVEHWPAESETKQPPEITSRAYCEKHQDEGLSPVTRSCLEPHVLDLSRLHIQDGLSAALDPVDNGYFDLLPYEVIQVILHHLDLVALCRMATTCRLLWQYCYDPLQYTELNLQPFWPQIRDASLEGLRGRCGRLQRLNLSWCGGYQLITQAGFKSFLQVCSPSLTSLQLASCRFMSDETLVALITQCTSLQGLGYQLVEKKSTPLRCLVTFADVDLQCNRMLTSVSFRQLTKLTRLQRMNLYRTAIDGTSLNSLIRSCPDLQVLNLGACWNVSDFDETLTELGECCKKLRCIDLWRARTVTEVGMRALVQNCPLLEEIDAGWCPNLRSGSNVFVDLARRSPRLRKLFLTANRTVCDADLEAVAQHCPRLEQLDILGTREVSGGAAQRLLEKCKKLRMFDVSFCTGIDFETVKKWSELFPSVSIKKSFQSLNSS